MTTFCNRNSRLKNKNFYLLTESDKFATIPAYNIVADGMRMSTYDISLGAHLATICNRGLEANSKISNTSSKVLKSLQIPVTILSAIQSGCQSMQIRLHF